MATYFQHQPHAPHHLHVGGGGGLYSSPPSPYPHDPHMVTPRVYEAAPPPSSAYPPPHAAHQNMLGPYDPRYPYSPQPNEPLAPTPYAPSRVRSPARSYSEPSISQLPAHPTRQETYSPPTPAPAPSGPPPPGASRALGLGLISASPPPRAPPEQPITPSPPQPSYPEFSNSQWHQYPASPRPVLARSASFLLDSSHSNASLDRSPLLQPADRSEPVPSMIPGQYPHAEQLQQLSPQQAQSSQQHRFQPSGFAPNWTHYAPGYPAAPAPYAGTPVPPAHQPHTPPSHLYGSASGFPDNGLPGALPLAIDPGYSHPHTPHHLYPVPPSFPGSGFPAAAGVPQAGHTALSPPPMSSPAAPSPSLSRTTFPRSSFPNDPLYVPPDAPYSITPMPRMMQLRQIHQQQHQGGARRPHHTSHPSVSTPALPRSKSPLPPLYSVLHANSCCHFSVPVLQGTLWQAVETKVTDFLVRKGIPAMRCMITYSTEPDEDRSTLTIHVIPQWNPSLNSQVMDVVRDIMG